IDDKDTPEHYSPTYREQVEIALDYWEKGGNGALSYQPEFKIIDNPDADINVRWVENLEKVEEPVKEWLDTVDPPLSGTNTCMLK
ncbi:MAG: peptidase M10A and M12B matrixin and adamalysin, partial [Methanohalophilus sp.]